MTKDIFRKEYRQLNTQEIELVHAVKDKAKELYLIYCNNNPDMQIPSREMAIAITKLEESVMWALKSITK